MSIHWRRRPARPAVDLRALLRLLLAQPTLLPSVDERPPARCLGCDGVLYVGPVVLDSLWSGQRWLALCARCQRSLWRTATTHRATSST